MVVHFTLSKLLDATHFAAKTIIPCLVPIP